MKTKTAEISLTDEQWVEIYYALDSKISGIHAGYYGPDNACQWQNQLRGIMAEIEKKVVI